MSPLWFWKNIATVRLSVNLKVFQSLLSLIPNISKQDLIGKMHDKVRD